MKDLYFSQYGFWQVPLLGTGTPDVFAEEKELFEDARRLQRFYPKTALQIQQYVEEECDKMEYDGSMMFDEYPDRITIYRLTEKIADQVYQQNAVQEEKSAEKKAHSEGTKNEEDLKEQEMLVQQGRGPHRPPRRDHWVEELVQVILLDEMHRRRCRRHRTCRRSLVSGFGRRI